MDVVRIIYHREPGSWWAESPDVERWYAAGAAYAEVRELAEEGIPFVLGRAAELEHYVPARERFLA
jgi:predicted RNase H-like HicB family nuclease